ncbi:hypothetical protein [Antarcticimicrobium sediminis]|uniref:hypothetical protein n=1 Tax=Antarcticimicrobium sediminis TaxID=2546227 RepID=UPI0019D190BB
MYLANNPNRLLIAEDHDLSSVLNRVKAAPGEFRLELRPADQSFDITGLAADYAACAGSLGAEQLEQPFLWREVGRKLGHVRSMAGLA